MPTCCVIDGCRSPAPPDAPLDLCEPHLVVAAEWASRELGAPDLLPAPCRLCGSRLGVRFPSGWLCAVCEWTHGELVDAELPPPRVDVVYYLRFEDRVKIGTSGNPRQRLAAIRHDDLLGFERGDRRLEHRRHAQFLDERFDRTEWFRLSDRLRAHIETVRCGAQDPWDLYARWLSEAAALRG
ncbi:MULTISPECIES: GIY-YIG nuclease family protein [unclassified Microbacterium]|uniref:GIY-YIG nuclease family protein n=1 Tax=unclassified Microbacterium TaxID=2609290 RepID=UPI00214B7AB9|nr:MULTISPECIES: GIY-YIG nuclease family protein [unclassified Microbacterium]MCR2809820.1 GIY-YIG nuclease family protein [Microbacterium sp. zg.B185]WIM17870.1 GIY-YIG nuclease family protein [Microbacterium sp. zg-B185]